MSTFKCSVFSSRLCINVYSNSKRIVDFLVHNDFNKEFIPSMTIEKVKKKCDFNLSIHTDCARNRVVAGHRSMYIETKTSKFYLPDITFLLLSVFSKLYLDRKQVVVHSTVVNNKGKGILIIGEQGDGKKELALLAALGGSKIVSCENTVIEIKSKKPHVIASTNLLDVGIDKKEFYKKKRIKIIKKSLPKSYLNYNQLKELGIGVLDYSGISFVLYAKIVPGSKMFDSKMLKYPDTLLRFYKCTGTYVSGGSHLLLSTLLQFPNLENEELRAKRIDISRIVAKTTKSFEIFGDPNKAVDFIRGL